MIDFITCIDLRLPIEPLLTGERLLFPLSVDEQTGEVLNGPRKAKDKGLEFTLTPSTVRPPLRCKLTGSLHKYRNQGIHNANDYTAADLTATLIELATTYQIDLNQSPLNNMEFGVNIALPFPVGRVLDNLISYKNRLFSRELEQGKVAYECVTQRYVLKLYDKGLQHREDLPDLPPNLLRIEMKVLKMEYLTRQGIELKSLADLLDSTHYAQLGQLLSDAFQAILFDEPSVDLDQLSPKQQRLCLEGRDARTWLIPEETPNQQRAALAKQIQRREHRFRALLATHRQGDDWVSQTAELLTQQWHRLTVNTGHKPGKTTPSAEKCPVLTDFTEKVSTINRLSAKVSSINRLSDGHPVSEEASTSDERGTLDNSGEKRPKLTPSVNARENPKVSTINRLSIGLKLDNLPSESEPVSSVRGTPPIEEESTRPASASNAAAAAAFSSSSKPIRSFETRRPIPAPIPTSSATPTTTKADRDLSPRRQCSVTGIDITHQHVVSRTVSLDTLTRYHQQEPDRFNQILDRFLPLPGSPVARYWRIDSLHQLIKLAGQHPQAPLKRLRACPISGADITHQAPTSPTATHDTLKRLPRNRFDALAHRYLTPEQNQLNQYGRIKKLTFAIRQDYQRRYGEKTPAAPARQCPITGIDITDQPLTSPTVTPATLRGLPETRIDELTRQHLVSYDYHRTFSAEQRIDKLVLVIRKLYRAQHQEPVEVAPKLVRYCPVTGLDITHQLPTCLTVTESTLKRLAPDQFDALAERYLLPGHNRLGSHARIAKLALVIRQASQGLPVAVSTTPARYCAMTGVDITHQRSDTVLAGRKTLQRLISSDPDRIDELSIQFLTPAQQQEPITHRCFWLANVIRQRYEQRLQRNSATPTPRQTQFI